MDYDHWCSWIIDAHEPLVYINYLWTSIIFHYVWYWIWLSKIFSFSVVADLFYYTCLIRYTIYCACIQIIGEIKWSLKQVVVYTVYWGVGVGGCVTLPRDHPYLKDLAALINGKITNLLNHPTDPIFTFIAQHRNCLLSIEAPGIMSCCKIIICNHFCGKAPLEPGFASTLLDDHYKRYTTAVLVHRFSYRRLDLSGA